MKFQLIVLCLVIPLTFSAPLQMQWQSQMSIQPTQEELSQLLALQPLQMANSWNDNIYPQVLQKIAPPIMIIMPDTQSNTRMSTNHNNVKNLLNSDPEHKDVKDNVTVDYDLDSVIIDSDSESEPKPEYHPQKAILLFPTRTRFSIGGLISAIPFLPIEVNVPDTVSWIYNGIASIIAGIGQRLPVNRPPPTEMPPENLRLLLKRLQSRNQPNPSPILVLPDVAQMYPMQI